MNLLSNNHTIIESLNPYMIYSHKILELTNKINIKKNCNKSVIKLNNNLIQINDNDKLFWFFYICKYDFESYLNLNNNKFLVEKHMKIDSINESKKNKNLLKDNKIKISEYESNLLNDTIISLKTLKGLCIFNNLSILIIEGKKYFDFDFGVNKNVIFKNNNNIGMELNVSLEKINDYKKNKLLINNLDRNLKGVSSYKVSELKDICLKLNINFLDNTNKVKKKDTLYREILETINSN